MGQKVHPESLRVGYIHDWKANWFNERAFADYLDTGFGGWPWPSDDPVHGPLERGRFARHADGHEDEPAPEPYS